MVAGIIWLILGGLVIAKAIVADLSGAWIPSATISALVFGTFLVLCGLGRILGRSGAERG